MSERDTKLPGHPDGLAPETRNREQDDDGTQAQDVASDAMHQDSATTSPLESTKVPANDYDPAPDSTGDLIDEMRRMEGEGRIDMSAFAGEPNHDDEPGLYGGETTDDDDAEWLTADGEALNEEEVDTLLDDEDEGDDELAGLEDLLADVEVPGEDAGEDAGEDGGPDEIEPLPDDDATTPGDDEALEEDDDDDAD
ncbi:hypothetical protein ACLBKU_06660 [Erythrobacter sp. NE805]|uniref:hypothetical protein n=1 Tax=Erythrobacter sp. NE805 TaxID=3389875 RepID=UPI00396B417B